MASRQTCEISRFKIQSVQTYNIGCFASVRFRQTHRGSEREVSQQFSTGRSPTQLPFFRAAGHVLCVIRVSFQEAGVSSLTTWALWIGQLFAGTVCAIAGFSVYILQHAYRLVHERI